MTIRPTHPTNRRRSLQVFAGLLAPTLMPWPVSAQTAATTPGASQLAPWSLPKIEGTAQWAPRNVAGAPWLYLDFWASWCGPCKLSFPWMNTVHDQWSSKGLRIVAVSLDRRREDAVAFLRAHPARFEVAFDAAGELARSLKVKTMPTSILVAPDGVIHHRHEGFTNSIAAQTEASLRQILNRPT